MGVFGEYIIYNGELYHHGIKGMKWGVRRYQKKDGTLTSAGKKRYSDDPAIGALKSDTRVAKKNMKIAEKAYNKALNKSSYMPTKKNTEEAEKALKAYTESKNAYKNTKLKYTTDKEVARIKDRGVEFKDKSKHRLKLEEQYKKLGMTDEEAQAAANKRIRTEKILVASAAVTVTACAAYAANKEMRRRIDTVIKAGEKMQRIEMKDTGGKLYDAFYVAKGDKDMKRYEKMLGYARQQQAGKAYMMKLEAAKDIKVASQRNAAKVFVDMYNNDAEFRKSVGSGYGDKLSSRNAKKAYEGFNRALTAFEHKPDSPDTRFYNKLKKLGYGAIQDVNDMKYSGYGAKNPLIVFDNSNNKNVMVKSFSELSKVSAKDATVEQIKGLGRTFADQYLIKYGSVGAAGLTLTAANTYYSDPTKEYEKLKR